MDDCKQRGIEDRLDRIESKLDDLISLLRPVEEIEPWWKDNGLSNIEIACLNRMNKGDI